MRNKGAIITITVLITVLCIYYLSFTLVSRNVQQKARVYATNTNGTIDFSKKQQYLDSISKEPVYNLLGIKYTYEEVQEEELSLGLDLQGGMHVTLEVSPVEIIKGLSGNSEDKGFLAAIEAANEAQRTSQENYLNLFYKAWNKNNANRSLSSIFANAANRGRISSTSSDDAVLKVIQTEIDDAIDRSFIILRTRIDKFGTTAPNIQKIAGTGRIQIELPGVENQERVRKLLQGVAKLEFLEVFPMQEVFPVLQSVNDFLVADQKQNAPVDTAVNNLAVENEETPADTTADDLASQLAGSASDTTANLDSLKDTSMSPLFSLLQSSPQFGLVYSVSDTMKINRILNRPDIQSLMPQNMKFLWSVKPTESNDKQLLALYAVRTLRGGKAPLTGEIITDARQDLDQGRPSVSMQMNSVGARGWRKLTAENIGQSIAIVLDDYVYSAPVVQNEIPGGNSQITGNFTLDEAKDLANILKAGSLPAPTRIVEEAIVGPTLGTEAQVQSVISIISGLVIVMIFMIAYYSKGGLIANLALIFNVFFILGVLANVGGSLTVPGIAGIVLTIGMSLDANVLIFERIKEELRHGVSLMNAISLGYQRAYSSIIDSNLTTFITALILFLLGQGPVKGFATTLMIGIVCSFFTAVFITRVIITIAARKGDNSKISFDFPWSKNVLANLNVDFLSKRKYVYYFSSAVIVLGILLTIAEGGLNLGVDFTGGRSYVVRFNDPVVASELKTALTDDFQNAGTEVKTFGANNVIKVTTSYLVGDESSEADENVKGALVKGLSEHLKLNYVEDDAQVKTGFFSISSSSKVGATIADDITSASIEAVIFSLIAIFIYILFRFRKWQYSLGAVVALFHDVMFIFAAFAIARLFGISYEVDQVFVAAVLTVIGYSINDTVIVFDRIREFLGLNPRADYVKTINDSINQTMNRTLITSMTTLIVVIILYLFGGEVLKGFSFALMVGILVGTYSSIYIATPIVIDLDKKSKNRVARKEAVAQKA